MHVCPMQTPAVVPIPHVGGPIVAPGEPRVLIGGLPAARVGDFCVCVGPPDVIAMGSFTVLIGGKPAARMGDMTAHGGSIVGGFPQVMIGDSGGGAGSPAGLTMAGARASGAAFTRTNCACEGVVAAVKDSPLFAAGNPDKKSFIEIELVDQKGRPVAHERFRVVAPDQKPFEGFLDERGFARIDGIDPGTCVITFPALDAASWKPETGDQGRVKRPVPEPEILPSIGPVRLTTIKGQPFPSIGPVRLTSRGVLLPSIGPVVLTPFTGVPFPSIGPIKLQILKGNLLRLGQIGVRASSVKIRALRGPGIAPPSVRIRVVGGPGIAPSTVKIRVIGGPTVNPPSVRIRVLGGPGVKLDTIRLRTPRLPGVRLDSITVRPTRG